MSRFMKMSSLWMTTFALVCTFGFTACSGEDQTTSSSAQGAGTNPDNRSDEDPKPGSNPNKSPLDSLWSDTAPTGSEMFAAGKARAEAQAGKEILVEGRAKEFVNGLAAFTLIDRALKSCREMEGDTCTTPWDYCCEESDRIAENTITIEVRGEDGRPLRTSLKGFHDLDHLDHVIVRGEVERDASGNVIVIARALHTLDD